MAEQKSMADIGTNKTEEQKEVPTPSREESKNPFGRWDINRATWAIFAVTFVYAVFAGLQWWTIKDQSNLIRKQIQNTQEQFAINNRPWVNINEAKFGEPTKGKAIMGFLTMINSGNTPALNVTNRIRLSGLLSPYAAPSVIDKDKGGDKSKSILPPNTVFAIPIIGDVPLTDAHIEAIKTERMRIYVWGRIEYDDIWGNHYITDFCAFKKPDIEFLNNCESGNTMD